MTRNNPTDFELQLRHFSTDVSLAVALEVGGRISEREAYRRIRRRWKQLKESKKEYQGLDPLP